MTEQLKDGRGAAGRTVRQKRLALSLLWSSVSRMLAGLGIITEILSDVPRSPLCLPLPRFVISLSACLHNSKKSRDLRQPMWPSGEGPGCQVGLHAAIIKEVSGQDEKMTTGSAFPTYECLQNQRSFHI